MFVRLTFFDFLPDQLENLKRIYHDEIVPIVKKQKGNIGVWLLEPTESNDQFISLTEWKSRADADVYESSGTYRELVNKVKEMYRSKPVLKTYNVTESKVTAAS
jgi:heme-degrading monooxygenase HmoA